MLKVLKTTSVIASWARAWTLEFLIRRHHSQQKSFMRTVLAMILTTGRPRLAIEWSLEVSRSKHWRETWKNEVIIMTEKTSTPIGSSRRLPMGYEYWSWLEISLVVIHTIAVLRKSRAASTRDARMERELVRSITASFPARRNVLAIRLIYIAIVTMRLPLSSALSSWYSNSWSLGPSPPSPSNEVFSSGNLYMAFGVRFTFTLALLPFSIGELPSSGCILEGSSQIVCGTLTFEPGWLYSWMSLWGREESRSRSM